MVSSDDIIPFVLPDLPGTALFYTTVPLHDVYDPDLNKETDGECWYFKLPWS